MRRGLFLVVASSLALCACGTERTIEVRDPWTRPVPPVAASRAIYMDIANGLDEDVVVVGATAEACGSLELHETSLDAENVMRMAPLRDGLAIPSGGVAVLEPGGLHLMCVGPSADAVFDLTLRFAAADPVTVTVAIDDR